MRPSSWTCLALLGACATEPPPPDPAAIRATFEDLHARIYEVYALPPDRDRVWTLLAGSFTGPALTREYVEHWATKARMAREGTAIDIRRVEVDALELLEVGPHQVRIEAAWSVGGVVSHRRHKHPRVNRYQAVYTLVPTGEGWRIADTAVRNAARVRSPSRDGDVFEAVDGEAAARGGYLDPLDLLDAGIGADTGEADTDPGRDTDPTGPEGP